MALPLTARGEEMLSWLPRWLQGDPHAQGVIDVMALENTSVEADTLDLLDQFFVQTATWGLIYWEQMLELPVAPDGLTDAQRRTIILTKLVANKAQSGAQFRAVLDEYVETYSLRMDHSSGTFFITLTYNEEAYTEAQLEAILNSIFPAHLNLNVAYEGFLAGISEAGDPL